MWLWVKHCKITATKQWQTSTEVQSGNLMLCLNTELLFWQDILSPRNIWVCSRQILFWKRIQCCAMQSVTIWYFMKSSEAANLLLTELRTFSGVLGIILFQSYPMIDREQPPKYAKKVSLPDKCYLWFLLCQLPDV